MLVGLAVGAMGVAELTHVPEHGGHVGRGHGEGLPARAVVRRLVGRVGRGGVVVDVHSAALDDAPCCGAETGPAGAEERVAVDTTPGDLGAIERG